MLGFYIKKFWFNRSSVLGWKYSSQCSFQSRHCNLYHCFLFSTSLFHGTSSRPYSPANCLHHTPIVPGSGSPLPWQIYITVSSCIGLFYKRTGDGIQNCFEESDDLSWGQSDFSKVALPTAKDHLALETEFMLPSWGLWEPVSRTCGSQTSILWWSTTYPWGAVPGLRVPPS